MNRHLSSEDISRWLLGERTLDGESHARHCGACRGEIERVQKTFSLFRESGQLWSAHVYGSPVSRRRAAVVAWAGPLAACLLMGAILLMRPAPAPPAAQQPFLELPYVAPLAPYERTFVTRMDVPVAALIAAGFEVHIPDVAGSVRADVVFGQDGRAHAIRVVSQVLPNSDRRVNP